MKFYYSCLLLSALLFCPTIAGAQKTAIKTNVLYWGTLTPNISVETAVSQKVTLEVSGSYNPWDFSSGEKLRKFQHWTALVGAKYWIYEKFDGHFLGAHAFFGSYNAGGLNIGKLNDYRYEGYAIGASLDYGYQWYLGPHWNLEATVGIGYAYLNYDRYDRNKCGDFYGHKHRNWVGPTRLGLSFIYIIKSKK